MYFWHGIGGREARQSYRKRRYIGHSTKNRPTMKVGLSLQRPQLPESLEPRERLFLLPRFSSIVSESPPHSEGYRRTWKYTDCNDRSVNASTEGFCLPQRLRTLRRPPPPPYLFVDGRYVPLHGSGVDHVVVDRSHLELQLRRQPLPLVVSPEDGELFP